MGAREHSTLREGIVAGLLGSVAVALWFLAVDSAAGHPLRTPNVLGQLVFHGRLKPIVGTVLPDVVAGYSVLHLLLFVVVGTLVTLLAHLASRNIELRMGVWLGLVVAFCLLTGLTFMLTQASGERFPLWSVVGGSLLAVVVMGWYLWRRHPQLGHSFKEAPLGDEVEPPPHPPSGPRAGGPRVSRP